jgi:hypothetical protein
VSRLRHDDPPPLIVDVRDNAEVAADIHAGGRIPGTVFACALT